MVCLLDAWDDGVATVGDVGVDAAPRTIISEPVPVRFPLGSVPHLDDVVAFTVDHPLRQLGHRLWFLLVTYFG